MRRESRRTKNNMIIGTLCAVVMVMAVAYALANTSLNINTTTNISSTWNIMITDIRTEAEGQASDDSYTYSGLDASFNTHLVTPVDSMVYHVDVTNNGNLNATLTDIKKKITNKNKYININFSGFTKGDVLNAGETKTLDITVTFDYDEEGNFTDSIESNIDISLDFAQEGSAQAPDRSYGITYDCVTNGGNDCSSYNTTLSDNEVDLTYKAEKEGYEFVGWNTDKDATTGLKNIDAEDGLVLYAIYKKDIVITYEIRSEEITSIGKTSEIRTLFNKEAYEVTLPSITTNTTYYAVDGWYNEDVYSGLPNETYTITDSVTLNARVNAISLMESGSDFQEIMNSVKTTVSKIEFVDTDEIEVPSQIDNNTSWDVSAASNKSVIAWLDGTNLYIGGKGGVVANSDLSNLFNNFTNVKDIKFNDNFDTSNVTNVSYMFSNCSALTELNLSNFDTSEVTNMSYMFESCGNLKSIYVTSGFSITNVTSSDGMFDGCQSLVGGNGTKCYEANVGNASYARIDTSEAPGYFTDGYNPKIIINPVTSSTITVIATVPATNEISKYEFSIDGTTYEDKGTNNSHKFNNLTHNTEYTIYVRVTMEESKQTTNSVTVKTVLIDTPTFSDTETDEGIDVEITYPSGDYTFEYSIDEGENFIPITPTNNKYTVSFTEEGEHSVIARVTDKDNTNNVVTTSSYTVEISKGGSSSATLTKLNASVVTTGDGLYEDETEEGRYVYRGADPDNYITFNNETWRILAIESDGTIKIIKNEVIGNKTWNDNGNNTWEGSTLNEYLNSGDYWNTSLLNTVKENQIEEHSFNVGSLSGNESSLSDIVTAEKATTWTGNVGLMTASDYIKAHSDQNQCSTFNLLWSNYEACKGTNYLFTALASNWQYPWTISPYSDNTSIVWDVSAYGDLLGSYVLDDYGVAPVLYLKSSILISGTGTTGDKYTVG